MTDDVNQPESSVEELPPLNPSYRLLPEWFILELRSFVSPDHDFALMYEDASLTEAVKMIGSGLKLTEAKFDKDRSGWPSWWETERVTSRRHAGLWRTAQAINGIFEIRDQIVWPEVKHSRKSFQGWPPPRHIMKSPKRWKHFINERASAFFFLNRVEPNNIGPLRNLAEPMTLSSPLKLLSGVPSLDLAAEACRIAERLTAKSNPSRNDYAAKTFKPTSPNIPGPLCEAVAFQMSKIEGLEMKKPSPSTIRGYLIDGGYNLPWKLMLVMKGKHRKG